MPKRTTTTFTSEDQVAQEDSLHVYFCRFTGEHCLITGASQCPTQRLRFEPMSRAPTRAAFAHDTAQREPPCGILTCARRPPPTHPSDVRLNELPRRRTDGAYIIDTQNQLARLQCAAQAPKLVKRGEAHFEKQFRYHTRAELPFAYRTEPEGRFLYVLPDALTVRHPRVSGVFQLAALASLTPPASRQSFASDEVPQGGVPVPPCIQRVVRGVAGGSAGQAAAGDGGGAAGAPTEATQVALSIEERAKAVAVLRISADDVSVSVTGGAQQSASITELLDLFSRVLGCKHAQLYLNKGWSDRSKMLLVRGLSPQEVHGKLNAWLEAEKARGRAAGA